MNVMDPTPRHESVNTPDYFETLLIILSPKHSQPYEYTYLFTAYQVARPSGTQGRSRLRTGKETSLGHDFLLKQFSLRSPNRP